MEGDAHHRRVSDHVVHTLAKIIAEARAGNVDAVGIVTVSPEGKPRFHFGGDGGLVPSVNLGLDMAKATFMAQIIGEPGARVMNSGLVMPGEG
jgi:hypothetical protein